jgi:SAM-dependent methyltransferase
MDWRIKVTTQFLLAHLPLGWRVNFLLQLVQGSHAPEEMSRRIVEVAHRLGWMREQGVRLTGCRVVEIGTGWDAINPLLLSSLGAGEIYTFDHLAHLRFGLVHRLVTQMAQQVRELADLTGVHQEVLEQKIQAMCACRTLTEIFRVTGIRYCAPGDAANTPLASHSVDLVYTHAVYEHLPEQVIDAINREAYRILKPTGWMYHAIGLHDHYVSVDKRITKVNFLQYSERTWKMLVKNKISFHNRLREKHFFDMFVKDGFKIVTSQHDVDPDSLQALGQMQVDPMFGGLTPEELAVTFTQVLLKKRGAVSGEVGRSTATRPAARQVGP